MKRLLTALFSAALVATIFAGTPAPTFAAVDGDDYYIATELWKLGGEVNTGQCATPDREVYTYDTADPGTEHDAYYSIEDAINSLLAEVEDGDTIIICSGNYRFDDFSSQYDLDVEGGDEAPLNLTIRGAYSGETYLNGVDWWDCDPCSETFNILNLKNVHLTLENLSISNGGGWTGEGEAGALRAVQVENGSLTVIDVQFNDSQGDGAIGLVDADLTVADSFFELNDYFLNTSGAAIGSTTVDEISTSIDISSTEFRGNGANGSGIDGYGGAIATYCADMSIEGSFFKDNSSGLRGGSIYAGSDASCPGNTLTIDNTKFRSTSSSNTADVGGAILSEGQDLTITDSVFGRGALDEGGFGGGFGGGNLGFEARKGGAIAINDHTTGNATVTIADTKFGGNYANGSNGGAIWVRCADVSITGNISNISEDLEGFEEEPSSWFFDNGTGFPVEGSDNAGGAVFMGGDDCLEATTLDVDGVIFFYNYSDQGGAIATAQDNSDLDVSNINVANSLFFYNYADLDGGAINSDYAHVSINNSLIEYNRAYGESTDYNESERDDGYTARGGGAIDVWDADLSITDTDFGDNQAYNGHGGAVQMRGDGDMDISGTTFEGNGARHGGGAIYRHNGERYSSARDTISDSSFTDNSTGLNGDGGALFTDTTTGITSTSFISNEAGIYRLDDDDAFIGNNDNNDASGGAIAAGSHHDEEGDGDINAGLRLVNVTFRANSAADDGGAVFHHGPELSVTGSTFTSNVVFRADGGAIHTEAWGCQPECVTVTRSTFTQNYAESDGGAIKVDRGSIRVTSSTFSRNTAEDDEGGAIEIQSSFGRPSTIADSLFQGNGANDSSGGAVYMSTASLLTITTSRFFENEAEDGGAVNADEGASLSISGSDFGRNEATEDGGAIYINDDPSLVIRNTRFTANSAGYDGGAVYADTDNFSVFESNLFRANVALGLVDNTGLGGAVYLEETEATTIFSRNTVDSNRAKNGAGLYVISEENNSNAMAIHTNEFIGNVASAEGGGWSITLNRSGDAGQIPLSVRDNKFTRNRAYFGAAGVVYYNVGQPKVVQKTFTAITKTSRFQKNQSAVRRAENLMIKYQAPIVFVP
jgi:predicted outer membrane repeat protein